MRGFSLANAERMSSMNQSKQNIDSPLELIKSEANFSIEPCKSSVDLEDRGKFERLSLNSAQTAQVGALLQQVPQAMAAGALANAYVVSFPMGLPHTLTALRQGGFGTMIRENGRFVGSASLTPLAAQAAALGAFSAMSAVTGQYYLTQINAELRIMNTKLDDILSFLYGDKSAELIAEINFVKFVHANYSSIMLHEQQRLATLTNLQAARIVAMKNIEFYLTDLDAILKKGAGSFDGLCTLLSKALQIRDSIEMARQLYVVSGILELYCAQNFEEEYVAYLREETISYINKCDRRNMSVLSALRGKIDAYKPKPLEKVDSRPKVLQEIDAALSPYGNGNDSPIRISLQRALEALNRKMELYLSADGEIYMKKAA